jgi:hypothetical protein
VKRLLVGVALLLTLAACGEDRECLKGHTELQEVSHPVVMGGTTINGVFVPIYGTVTSTDEVFVCDQYAEEA